MVCGLPNDQKWVDILVIVFTPDHPLLSNSEHVIDHSKLWILITEMAIIIILPVVENVYC